MTFHLKLRDVEDDTAFSPSLNPSQKQVLANWGSVALHLSFLKVHREGQWRKSVLVTFNLFQLCCLLALGWRGAQNNMSKQISCSSVNREELTLTSVSLLHSKLAQNWEHTQHCPCTGCMVQMYAVWIRELSSLTCISPAMSLPWWLQWQVWNNIVQKRHGTQRWRDSHPSGRSLRNTVSGQLNGNKQIT